MGDFLVRIYYEDTDCGGIVYHTNYIKYCERARSEIFFSAGILPNTERVGLVVRKLNAEFLDSAKLGDLLVVKTKILKLGSSSLTLLQEIYRTPDSSLLDSAESAESAPFCHSERSEESKKIEILRSFHSLRMTILGQILRIAESRLDSATYFAESSFAESGGKNYGI